MMVCLLLQPFTCLTRLDAAMACFFDNYDDPRPFQVHFVNSLIPMGVDKAILFTGRHQDTRQAEHFIRRSSMAIQGSIELLLHKSSSSVEEKAETSKVATMLGRLPFTLDQDAAHIQSHGLSLRTSFPSRAQKQVVLQQIPDQ